MAMVVLHNLQLVRASAPPSPRSLPLCLCVDIHFSAIKFCYVFQTIPGIFWRGSETGWQGEEQTQGVSRKLIILTAAATTEVVIRATDSCLHSRGPS